jgi:branched-chain amino acid transport system ATP-binding protein
VTLLTVEGLSKRFGGVRALDNVSLAIEPGELVGVIGPNGSGKTTLINCVTGFIRPDSGRIVYNGATITNHRPDQLARVGLSRTFQQTMVFPDFTVLGNLEVVTGKHTDHTSNASLLQLVGLAGRQHVLARDLPFGDARRLGIAVAMKSRLGLLMLDEPAAGMSRGEKDGLTRLIRQIRDTGVAVCVVDHDMSFMLPLCDRLIVLTSGSVLVSGTPAEISANETVISTYLGYGPVRI